MRRLLTATLALGALAAGVASTSAATTPAFVACNPGGASAQLKRHPAHCTILPPSASFAEGVNLKSLDWKRWGEPQAKFTGVEIGFHLPPEHIKVHGRAYRLRPSPCGGQMVYTRVRVTSHFGSTIARPKACE